MTLWLSALPDFVQQVKDKGGKFRKIVVFMNFTLWTLGPELSSLSLHFFYSFNLFRISMSAILENESSVKTIPRKNVTIKNPVFKQDIKA